MECFAEWAISNNGVPTAANRRIKMEEYQFPGAAAAVLTAIMGRNPKFRVRKDLLRFKQFLETGEIATTEGSLPAACRALRGSIAQHEFRSWRSL